MERKDFPKTCGCKGVRTCLLCEEKVQKKEIAYCNESLMSYTYCFRCNLCWPTNTDLNGQVNRHPFMLKGVYLVPEFISRNEEVNIASKIDEIPWMASQSGRRKQDFGPKVNFKKRKLKFENFQGFPSFAWQIIKKLDQVHMLSDFKPVELCHLEYCPERGSSIDPHLDDFWLWGERLVTVNFLSETVLTLTPAEPISSKNCNCCNPKSFPTDLMPCSNCLIKLSATHLSDVGCDQSNTQNSSFTDACLATDPSLFDKTIKLNSTSHNHRIDPVDAINSFVCNAHSVTENLQSCDKTETENCVPFDDSQCAKIEVHINLPPRSLLILRDCARHHWFHEIKRKFITSRRLAMTFRELSVEFIEGGAFMAEGKKMLTLAERIID